MTIRRATSLLVAALAVLGCRDKGPQGLALVGATVIDGSGGPPLHDAVVVVRGTRIESVTPRAGFRMPKHTEQLDVTGRTEAEPAALARVQEAQGDIGGAIATLDALEALFEERTKPPDWEGELRSLKVRLWLASGEQARAVDWARHYPIQSPPNPLQETDLLTAARVWMAQKNYREAQHILERLNQAHGIEKRTNRKIKIDLLMACALAAQNQMPRAFQRASRSARNWRTIWAPRRYSSLVEIDALAGLPMSGRLSPPLLFVPMVGPLAGAEAGGGKTT